MANMIPQIPPVSESPGSDIEEDADFQRVKSLCLEVRAMQEQLKHLAECSRTLNRIQTGINKNVELSEAIQMTSRSSSTRSSNRALGQQDSESNSDDGGGGLDDDLLPDDLMRGSSKLLDITRPISTADFTGGRNLPRLQAPSFNRSVSHFCSKSNTP
jgi:hypothetical protein